MLPGPLQALVDLIFPWSCAVCGRGFEAKEGAGPICGSCLGELEELEAEPCCGLCAMPLPMEGSPCNWCVGKGVANFERIVRLGAFTGPLRSLVHQVKYHKRWSIGEELADRLLRHERAKELLTETELLVPVPLHWRRQLARWFNQAQVVARRLGKRCGIKVAMAVRRVRNTPTQTHMSSRAQRERNLADALLLKDPRAVAGKHVVIVDDVWTTGATMQAMARVLKTARPASLSALVIAAADPKGHERPEGSRAGVSNLSGI